MSNATVLIGDCRERLKEIAAESVHVVCSSPPYFSLRSYLPKDDANKALEIGSEGTPEAYVETMVAVMREVWRVLHPTGCVFLNIGDTYASGKGTCFNPGGGDHRYERHEDMKDAEQVPLDRRNVSELRRSGLKPLDLVLIPERLVLALQAAGWIIRSRIIWRKAQSFDPDDVGTCMPESLSGARWRRHMVNVRGAPPGTRNVDSANRQGDPAASGGYRADVGGHPTTAWQPCPGCPKCSPTGGYVLRWGNWRATSAYEFIFMLTKSNWSYHDDLAVKEAGSEGAHGGGENHPGRYSAMSGRNDAGGLSFGQRADSTGRNLRNVWHIAPEPMTAGRCAQCGYLYSGREMGRLKKNAEHRRICSACGATKWVSHYATYPTELARICIRLGTSERGVCPKCLWPYVQMVEGQPLDLDGTGFRHERTGASAAYRDQPALPSNTDTLDRKRACGADASGEYHGTALKDHEAAGTQNPSDVKRNVLNGMDAGETTVGWMPSCKCGTDLAPIPATVLDPFWGSGRTGIAALELGRRVIGIELDERVIDLAFADLPMLWQMVEVRR